MIKIRDKATPKTICMYTNTRKILKTICEQEKMSASAVIEALIYKYKDEILKDNENNV